MNRKIWFILSIVVFIFSCSIYGYSKFNIFYIENKNRENHNIENELIQKKNRYEQLKTQSSQINEEFNTLSMNFYKTYGYQFDANKNEVINKEVLQLKLENENLFEKMKSLVTNYGNYYEGSIYDSDTFDAILGTFTQLSDFDNAERFKNIPQDLGIFQMLNKADGTIGYLKIKNSSSPQWNMYLFATALYSRNLNLMTKGEKITPADVYRDIVNLKHLYQQMENSGYQLGNLNAENLIYLDENFSVLLNHYYKNQGIIDALSGRVENEK